MQKRTTPPRTTATGISLALCCLCVVLLPLCRGGVDRSTEAAVLGGLGVAALLTAWKHPFVSRSTIPLAVVVASIGLQLAPVPPQLHGLSPAAGQVFRASLEPLGRYPAPRPFSLDVVGTAREAGKAIACLLAFIVAASFAQTERRRGVLLAALAAAGLVSAAGALVVGMSATSPLVAPTFPFVNPNHLAGLLNLTSFVSLGFAVRCSGQPRLVWTCAFATSVAALFLSLSRAGIAAFFVGLSIFCARYLASHTGSRRAPRAALAATVFGALAVGAFLRLGPVIREFRSFGPTDELKTHLWPAGLRVLRDYPLIGIGRGAFATVFPSYIVERAAVTYEHLENEWLQLPIELGAPIALLLFGTLVWSWARFARRSDLASPDAGLIAGLGALAVHQLFDFSTEILGVAIPLAVALGLLERSRRSSIALPRWAIRTGVLVATVCGASALAWSAANAEDGAVAVMRSPPRLVATAAAAAAARRPADYLPHLAAGARLAAEGECGEALRWLLRSMTFSPGSPEPHLHAARCLAAQGHSASALREYRLAFSLGRTDLLAEVALRWSRFEDLLSVVPDTPDGLLALGMALEPAHPLEARQAYARLWDEYLDPRATMPLAESSLRLGDPDTALSLAYRQRDRAPRDEESYAVAFQALVQKGQADQARAELELGLAARPGSARLVALLAWERMAAGRYAEAKRVAETLAPRSASELALREALAARALVGMGRLGEAIERARSSADAVPEAAAPLLELARLLAEAERFDEAVAIVERAQAVPGAKDYRPLLDHLRTRARDAHRTPTAAPVPDEDGAPLRSGQ